MTVKKWRKNTEEKRGKNNIGAVIIKFLCSIFRSHTTGPIVRKTHTARSVGNGVGRRQTFVL